MKKEDVFWYAVRTIYTVMKKRSNNFVYEERICVFKANSIDEAFIKAKYEGEEYASSNNFIRHKFMVSYMLDLDPLIDNHEVWSEYFETELEISEFIDNRYIRYDYTPEEPNSV